MMEEDRGYDLLDLIYDILWQRISFEEGIKKLEKEFTQEELLQAQYEGGYDLALKVVCGIEGTQSAFGRQLPPVDLRFLQYIIDKGANMEAVYPKKLVARLKSNMVDRYPKKDLSLLEIARHMHKAYQQQDSSYKEANPGYVGIVDMYELVKASLGNKPLAVDPEAEIVANFRFSQQTTGSLMWGYHFHFPKVLYRNLVLQLDKVRAFNAAGNKLHFGLGRDMGSMGYSAADQIEYLDIVLGIRLAICDCEGHHPEPVFPERIAEIQDNLVKKTAFLQTCISEVQSHLSLDTGDMIPGFFLLAEGPLACTTLVEGKLCDRGTDAGDDRLYFGVDQRQESHYKGVRGKKIGFSDGDIVHLEEKLKGVSGEMFLVTRYD